MIYTDKRTPAQKTLQWDRYKEGIQERGGATIGEIFTASFGEGQSMSTGGKLSEVYDIEVAKKEDSTLVSADEANRELEGLQIQYTEDVTRGEINAQKELLKVRDERSSIINKSGDSFFKGTVLPFTGRLVGAALDPADIAIGAVTGWGVGKAIGMVASKAVSMSVSKLATSPMGTNFVKALAGNVAAEVAISKLSKRTREEYTLNQAVLNATIGTAMMTGVFASANVAMKRFKKLGNKTLESITNTSEDLISAGKSPSKFLEMNDLVMTKIDKVSPELTDAINKHLPDIAEEILESESSISIMKALRESKSSKLDAIKASLEESGDLRANLANDNFHPKDVMTQAEQVEFKNHYDSEKSDLGYDPKGDAIRNQVPENSSTEMYDNQLGEQLSTLEKQVDEVADSLDQASKAEYDSFKVDKEANSLHLSALEEYGKCRGFV